MEEPGHGIIGRDSELARVQSFVGSVSEGPSALLLEGTAGIGKTTLWHAGVSVARARGHQVLTCRAAESEARLSYAALGDLLDFEPRPPGPATARPGRGPPPSRGRGRSPSNGCPSARCPRRR
jgi:hypothetical protein